MACSSHPAGKQGLNSLTRMFILPTGWEEYQARCEVCATMAKPCAKKASECWMSAGAARYAIMHSLVGKAEPLSLIYFDENPKDHKHFEGEANDLLMAF